MGGVELSFLPSQGIQVVISRLCFPLSALHIPLLWDEDVKRISWMLWCVLMCTILLLLGRDRN